MRGKFIFKGIPFSCDCPDFSGIHDSVFKGVPVFRDWSYSVSGSRGEQGEACKHIWATLLSLKLVEKADIPKDVPLLIFEQKIYTKNKEYYQGNVSRGNSFELPAVKSFKKYRGG